MAHVLLVFLLMLFLPTLTPETNVKRNKRSVFGIIPKVQPNNARIMETKKNNDAKIQILPEIQKFHHLMRGYSKILRCMAFREENLRHCKKENKL